MEGRIWGELYLTRTEDQLCFDASDVDLALVVAAQIGAALATAQHLDNVDQLAHTDPLTGLANRRSVDESLDIALSRHRSEGVPVSLIVCDLNGLKRINDEQGHDAGDRALVRFAGMLSRVATRLPGSIAARLGGDEFCIVVTDVTADDVVAAAEELCRLVLRSPLEGVSCGVASHAGRRWRGRDCRSVVSAGGCRPIPSQARQRIRTNRRRQGTAPRRRSAASERKRRSLQPTAACFEVATCLTRRVYCVLA